MKTIKKVLLLGSGAIKIGEAGEFDYSGSQAIKALKEEGVVVILVNPNIATIQTSKGMADEVYFLPITWQFVEKVIEKEKPDGILLSFGGQSALNCGIDLHKHGILKKHSVAILGTPIEAIIATEDRLEFAKRLHKLDLTCAKGNTATTVDEAVRIAQTIGFPLMIRSGFTLGGAGSGVVANKKELIDKATKALVRSPQIIVEESLFGWKEIEYEVVRDKNDNCITVCNMENFDPVGIHTGESIVVAPSQTLNDEEYYSLRQKSINVIRNLQIIGECNIQFALHPTRNEVRVIEVNARLSRSSALASKATGYPLAYVAAKLALGKTLFELPNTVTKKTTAFFEPALDYVVVKMPRWDLDKFDNVEMKIGSEMKSVGEVMSIGRSFPEAIQKAARMLNDGYRGVIDVRFVHDTKETLLAMLKTPTSKRLFTICSALYAGVSIDTIHEITHIDPWFLSSLQEITEIFGMLIAEKHTLSKDTLRRAKQYGFSDEQIADCVEKSESEIRQIRKQQHILPVINSIDTTAGEFPAQTNYLYMTYNSSSMDGYTKAQRKRLQEKQVIVLGCGPYSIGTSVEFDWCATHTVLSLKHHGIGAIVINCNPETVSTDFNVSDTLYFEELTLERVLDIYEVEQCPIVVCVGGQIANNLAPKLAAAHVPILGTDPENIQKAENRREFSALLDRLQICQPAWSECESEEQALLAAAQIGYPLIIRPSFVLSGKAMSIVYSEKELASYLKHYTEHANSYKLVISKFYPHTKECDIDGVAQNGIVLTHAISEHVEEAGVHSGDSTLVFAPYSLDLPLQSTLFEQTSRIVKELAIHGPFNIQYLIVNNTPYVIECNARASRSFPFVSKAMDLNFISLATTVLLNNHEKPVKRKHIPYTCVKVAQFSYHKLRGADPVPRVEMTSTGEVASFGETKEEAFLKALLSTGVKYPVKKTAFVSVGGDEEKKRFLPSAKRLADCGFRIYATSGTSLFLKNHGISSKRVGKIHEGIHPTVEDLLNLESVDMAIIISEKEKGFFPSRAMVSDGYMIRRMSIDRGIPVFTNTAKAALFIEAISALTDENLNIKPWSYYIKQL
jgi:carbamoyl-phosphate synthase large subunit